MIMQPTKNGSVTIIAATDDGEEMRYDLPPNEGVFVGRSGNCGFKLPDAGIADIHCRVEYEAGKLWIQDWMSNGGTRVNGESIWTKVEIPEQAEIRIGTHTLSFVNHASNGPDGNPDSFEPSETDQANEREINTPDELFDLEVEFFDDAGDGDFDPEVVEVLQAEIDQLRAELAQREADQRAELEISRDEQPAEQSDEVLERMQDLIDEANRSDERVAILEEMLQAAETANRLEQEERQNLEAWVGDIEKRIGQREDEHAAEIELVRNRLEESVSLQEQLQRRLHRAASNGKGSAQHDETLKELQHSCQDLQARLAETQKENLSLQQRVEQSTESQEHLLREERAKIAQEQAKVSRMRFELTEKLSAIEELPKSENSGDQAAADRISTLRQHLREIHQQEKQAERDAPLTTKLARLWKRVEA